MKKDFLTQKFEENFEKELTKEQRKNLAFKIKEALQGLYQVEVI